MSVDGRFETLWRLPLRSPESTNRSNFSSGMALDAVAAGPSLLGHVVRAEKAVEPGKVDGEVHVDRFLLDPVVPVVEARRDHESLQPGRRDVEVGMDEARVEVDYQQVSVYQGKE